MESTCKRILIVDDEEDLTWSISRSLQKNSQGIEVFCANSGDAAMTALQEREVDLIVSDLRMPGLNGLDLVENLRDQYPNVRVIVMTAFGTPEVKSEILRRGAHDYIEKPFEIFDLKKMIYSAID